MFTKKRISRVNALHIQVLVNRIVDSERARANACLSIEEGRPVDAFEVWAEARHRAEAARYELATLFGIKVK
jgi:hypothetical protein